MPLSKRFNALLPSELMEAAQERCAREGRTMSGVVCSMLANFIEFGLPDGDPVLSQAQVAQAADMASAAVSGMAVGRGVKVDHGNVAGAVTSSERESCVCLHAEPTLWGDALVVDSVPLSGGGVMSSKGDAWVGSNVLPAVTVFPEGRVEGEALVEGADGTVRHVSLGCFADIAGTQAEKAVAEALEACARNGRV